METPSVDPGPQLVGRHAESRLIEDVVGSLGDPALLVLHGAAGIGKSALWRYGLSMAATSGHHVLTTRPGVAESSWTGLTDLLSDVGYKAFENLPDPQRRAIDIALLRTDVTDDELDPRSLGMAVLGVLHELARSAPVMLAVDDLQWLDPSTLSVLDFVLRRAKDPLLLLGSVRGGVAGSPSEQLSTAVAEENLSLVEVGPMIREDLAPLLRAKLHVSFPAPVIAEIERLSAGNPFFAIEIGRTLVRRGTTGAIPDRLPVPQNLEEIIESYLGELSDEALRVLLVVAASPRSPLPAIVQVIGDEDLVLRGLAEAERAQVIEIGGEHVFFRHPLLSSAIYFGTPTLSRRHLHGRLAAAAVDPEERAQHLAQSTTAPNPDVARALRDAAELAVKRGALPGAASLLDRAIAMVGDDDRDLRPTLLAEAGRLYHRLGSLARARELLARAAELFPPGQHRGETLLELARGIFLSQGSRAALDVLARALESVENDRLRAAIHYQMSLAFIPLGQLDDAEHSAALAVKHARRSRDVRVLMEALVAQADAQFYAGREPSSLDEALLLEEEHGAMLSVDESASMARAYMLLFSDRLDEARDALLALLDESREDPDEVAKCAPLFFLSLLETRAGEYQTAYDYAREAYETALQTGRDAELASKRFAMAGVAAHAGELDRARALAEEALAQAHETEDVRGETRVQWLLGFIDLSDDRLDAAHEHLECSAELFSTVNLGEPGVIHLHGDLAEIRIARGDFEEAAAAIAWLDQRGEALSRPWAIGVAARGRGLLFAARGDTNAAVSELNRSIQTLVPLGQPFEIARSFLALGVTQRRAKQKRAAREAFERATEIFTEIGAKAWAEKALAETTRVGGRRSEGQELTETEATIATLVGEGLTNTEIAARLYISPRTVEANLTRVYRKMEVSSRAQLTQRLSNPGG